MIRKVFAVLIPILIIAGGAGVAYALIATAPDPPATDPEVTLPAITHVTVKKLPSVSLDVVTHGTVQPRTETTLVSEVAGRITKTHTSFVTGGLVEEGDVLLEIDDATYAANVATAKASLARAKAALTREEAEAELALREWSKYGKGEGSALVKREPQLAEARATVQSAEAMLDKAEVDLERTVIRAPYDGRIRRRHVDLGQFVNPGGPIATLYATDYVELRLPVSLQEVGYLELPLGGTSRGTTQAKVFVEVDLGATKGQWTGLITHTEGEVDPKTRMVNAVARIENPYAGSNPLLVGMFVTARISGRRVEEVFALPRTALQEDSTVLVVEAETDQLRKRKVNVVRVTESQVIISRGLEEGERCATSDLDVFIDGMKVQTRELER